MFIATTEHNINELDRERERENVFFCMCLSMYVELIYESNIISLLGSSYSPSPSPTTITYIDARRNQTCSNALHKQLVGSLFIYMTEQTLYNFSFCLYVFYVRILYNVQCKFVCNIVRYIKRTHAEKTHTHTHSHGSKYRNPFAVHISACILCTVLVVCMALCVCLCLVWAINIRTFNLIDPLV